MTTTGTELQKIKNALEKLKNLDVITTDPTISHYDVIQRDNVLSLDLPLQEIDDSNIHDSTHMIHHRKIVTDNVDTTAKILTFIRTYVDWMQNDNMSMTYTIPHDDCMLDKIKLVKKSDGAYEMELTI